MKFLSPINYEPIDMPYASTVYIELHYDTQCMSNKKTRSIDCFTVIAMNNGEMLKLDTCITDNNSNINERIGSPICSFESFMRHWNKIKF